MKVKNRLLDLDAVIYQNDEWFKFSLDSVLLAKFVTLNLRSKIIIDLATGNAPIPLLLSYRTKSSIYGVEYQDAVYQLGLASVLENHLDEQIILIHDDVRNLRERFQGDSFDVVTCNPPYFKVSSDKYFNENKTKARARHEIDLKLSDVLGQTRYLLKSGGIFAMVHRTERLVEIIEEMRKFRIEPKRIQFIYPKIGEVSDLMLIEGIKNGKPGLKMLSPLVIHNVDNSYTDEVNKILKF